MEQEQQKQQQEQQQDQTEKQEQQTEENAPLNDGGYKALLEERKARKLLEAHVKELQKKLETPDETTTEYEQRISQLENQIKQGKIEQEFLRAATKLDLKSDYQDLLLSAHTGDFTVENGQVLDSNGKSLDEWLTGQKTKMPELFNAPRINGTGSKSTRSAPSPRKSISRDDSTAYLANLDAIAKGEIDVI
jgi:hypothetical protein